jgi:hypothetical protein
MAREDALKPYSMEDYLGEYSKINPIEIGIRIRKEINEIRDQILLEKKCNVFLVGNKSDELFSKIINDLTKEGFDVSYTDILHKGKYLLGFKNKYKEDYILLIDSINSGKEVSNIINNFKGKLIRIYCHFSTMEGKEEIKKYFKLSDDIFKIYYLTKDGNDYRDRLLRNKLYCYSLAIDEGTGITQNSREYITNLNLDDFKKNIEDSMKSIMNCNIINLEKDKLFNYKLPQNTFKYIYSCDCKEKKCLKWFYIPQSKILFFSFNTILYIITIQIQPLGYMLNITTDITYDNFSFPPGMDKINCNLKKTFKSCHLKNIRKTSTEKNKINISIRCANCINLTIIKPITDEVLNNIHQKLDISKM